MSGVHGQIRGTGTTLRLWFRNVTQSVPAAALYQSCTQPCPSSRAIPIFNETTHLFHPAAFSAGPGQYSEILGSILSFSLAFTFLFYNYGTNSWLLARLRCQWGGCQWGGCQRKLLLSGDRLSILIGERHWWSRFCIMWDLEHLWRSLKRRYNHADEKGLFSHSLTLTVQSADSHAQLCGKRMLARQLSKVDLSQAGGTAHSTGGEGFAVNEC